MHGTELFTQLSILIVLVTIISILMKQLKQPLILGYILTGVLTGTLFPLFPGDLFKINTDSFEIFSSLGIALLLFIIGLDLKISVFKRLGPVVFTTALTILIILGGVGTGIIHWFGFGFTEAIVAGLALFFSSTIIIVKILSDKKEHNRLHGQIAIGVILVDDLVATLALLIVAAGKNGFGINELGFLFLKGVVLLSLLVIVSMKLLPKISKAFATSQELLFLFTMAWGLGVATLFQWTGFSIEVGALFAGVSLASLPYAQEMESRLKPLRDFFIVIFFITLGAGLDTSNLLSGLLPALVLSALVIVLKPLLVIIVLSLFGYTKRTSFKAGINLSQISEFSIILVAIAGTAGMVSKELTAIITIVALITIAISTYLMQYDNKILMKLEKRFSFFQDQEKHNKEQADEKYELILFGYRRGGHEFVKTFTQMAKKFIIIDYDPLVIESLEHHHFPYLYGDATDIEFLREIGVKNAKLVVSTITDFETNEQLIHYLHRVNPRIVFVCHADDYEQAALLYKYGASYVILPHYIGSEHINTFIRKNGTTKEAFDHYRKKHLYGLGRVALKED